MLKGRVNRHGEPVVSIRLILRDRPIKHAAVIDTKVRRKQQQKKKKKKGVRVILVDLSFF